MSGDMISAPRILYVASVDRLAGAERQLLYLAKGMQERGSPVACAFIFGDRQNLAPFEESGIECHLYAGSINSRWARLRWLIRLTRRGMWDVVHTFTYTPGVYGRVSAWAGGVRTIVASDRSSGDWLLPAYRVANRLLVHITDLVATNTEACSRFLTDQVGLSPDRICVIRNGVDWQRFTDDRLLRYRHLLTSELRLAPGEHVIGTIGNLTPWKNHGLLLDAAVLLKARGLRCRCLIAGNGPLADQTRRYARERGLDSVVHFLGQIPEAEAVLSALDVFVLSSSVEGMSNALLEALAAGLPCVVTDVGGNAEVVRNGDNGFVVPPDDAPALAARIDHLLTHPDEAAAMGKCGRASVQQFDIDTMVDAFSTVYRRLQEQKA